MLITKGSWRDAMLRFETPSDGGAGAGGSETPGTDPQASMTPEELRAELEKTRKDLKTANAESAARRKKLEEIETEESKRKEAEMTEVQKAEKRAADAETAAKAVQERFKANAIKSAVKLAAVKAGFRDPEDALRNADLSGVSVDDADNVVGADDAVKALATAKPYLVDDGKIPAPDINSGAGGRPQPLTPEQLAAQKRPTDGMYQPF
jgi:hypothetical protein